MQYSEAAREDTESMLMRMGELWPSDSPFGIDMRLMDDESREDHTEYARVLDPDGKWNALLCSWHIYFRDVNLHIYGWITDTDDVIVNQTTSIVETLEALGISIADELPVEDGMLQAEVRPTPRVLESNNLSVVARLFGLDPDVEHQMRADLKDMIEQAWREMTIDHSTAEDDHQLYGALMEKATKKQLTQQEKEEFAKLRSRMAQRAELQRKLKSHTTEAKDDDDLPGFYI